MLAREYFTLTLHSSARVLSRRTLQFVDSNCGVHFSRILLATMFALNSSSLGVD
jgi:hypothetical protein